MLSAIIIIKEEVLVCTPLNWLASGQQGHMVSCVPSEGHSGWELGEVLSTRRQHILSFFLNPFHVQVSHLTSLRAPSCSLFSFDDFFFRNAQQYWRVDRSEVNMRKISIFVYSGNSYIAFYYIFHGTFLYCKTQKQANQIRYFLQRTQLLFLASFIFF